MVPDTPISADPEGRIAGRSLADTADSYSNHPLDDSALSDYRQRYGLSVDPFNDDERFPLFTGAQRRELLDQLLHLCQFGNSLLVVLGEPGTGKTRIANALLDSMAETDEACFISAHSEQTVEQLLVQIAGAFNLRRDGNESSGQLLAALRSFSQPIMGGGDLALVVIDNAHNLNDQILAALLSLLQGREGEDRRLHMALFAETPLIARLDQLDMQDVLINDFYLEKFSLGQTIDYLNFRMDMADYLGPEIFIETLVEPWWQQAQGNLGLVHQYAREHLLESVLPPLTEKTRPFPLVHIIAAALLGAVFLMTFFYTSDNKNKEEQAGAVVSQSLPVKPIKEAAQPQEALDQNAQKSLAQASSLAPVVPELADAISSVVAGGEQASSASEITADPLNNSPSAPATKSATLETLSPPVEVAQAEPIAKAPEPVKASAPATSVPASAVKAARLSEDEQVLLSWRATEFTLQLLGVSTEKAAREFIASQSNRDDLLMFGSARKGKDWFVVVSGRYANSAAARAGIADLPAGQRKAGPWPRELKGIQDEISTQRGL